ncbi:hypothetical protein MTR67_000754 [Solanum verrucosum]|uniref:Uncharacterized protein n=1 Tax=Solanum verrucosum TaxID=315347 RepID=A0AAF0PSX7_SOLVR|nr:hypothetical protein MTR67_000754 [Solanum verrucosum]
MIASPIKFKDCSTTDSYWRKILDLENLMNSKDIRSKSVADVVEALIGASLISSKEVATLSFMKWIAMDIDFIDAPILRHFLVNVEKLVIVRYLEITATLQVL